MGIHGTGTKWSGHDHMTSGSLEFWCNELFNSKASDGLLFLWRKAKGLIFYPTCKLQSWPVTVSRMLVKDTRFLGQRQKTFGYSQQEQ